MKALKRSPALGRSRPRARCWPRRAPITSLCREPALWAGAATRLLWTGVWLGYQQRPWNYCRRQRSQCRKQLTDGQLLVEKNLPTSPVMKTTAWSVPKESSRWAREKQLSNGRRHPLRPEKVTLPGIAVPRRCRPKAAGCLKSIL